MSVRTSEHPKPLYKGNVSLVTRKTAPLRLSYLRLLSLTCGSENCPLVLQTFWGGGGGGGGGVWGWVWQRPRYEMFLALAHRHATLCLTLGWDANLHTFPDDVQMKNDKT